MPWGFRDALERELAGRVVAVHGQARNPVHGRDIHDRPGLPTTHAWQDETEHCYGTEEVDLELRSIVLLALLLNGADKIDTGIIDKHIDPAEVSLRPLDRGDPLLLLRHVQSDRDRPIRATRGETGHAVHRSRCQNDAIAALQHELGEGRAEPT